MSERVFNFNLFAFAFTTQLYFPGEARNERDPLFEAGTLMNIAEMADGQHARFDFVIET